MLVRYSLFPQDPPTNGLCSRELFVLARAVSATPPSIVIVALVLGGPERVRVVLSSSSSTFGGPEVVRVVLNSSSSTYCGGQ